MKQTTFASTGFEFVTKRTRKREFLDEMNLVVPWRELTGLIQPFAPAGKTGRSSFPIGLKPVWDAFHSKRSGPRGLKLSAQNIDTLRKWVRPQMPTIGHIKYLE